MMTFLFGLFVGVVLGAYLAWDRFLRYETPVISLKVTPEVGNELVEQFMLKWLARKDLTVMPKGREFHWPGEKS